MLKSIMSNQRDHYIKLAKRRARFALFIALTFENYERYFFLWNFDFD